MMIEQEFPIPLRLTLRYCFLYFKDWLRHRLR
jgi:hypothetical protein